jgi:riboflavin-specific deaminase-like protein
MDRPYYHINFAMTVDGRMAKPDGSRLRISSPKDMRRVHILRQELGAILVGVNTILMDDPKLTVKDEHVPSPRPLTKIVLDTVGKVPLNASFLKTPGRSLIAAGDGSASSLTDRIRRADPDNELDVEVLAVSRRRDWLDLSDLSMSLLEHGAERVMVEGGPTVISSFIEDGIFDRLSIYVGPMLTGGNGPSFFKGAGTDNKSKLSLVGHERLGEGLLLEYVPLR